jgi:hypothetical protein
MEPTPENWRWPDLGEPELVERLLLDQDAFHDLWVSMSRQMPAREYTDEAFELSTGYPWARPTGSFILEDGEGRLLGDLDQRERSRVLESFTGPGSDRTPMLAIGSNASPEGLWRKFAHFTEPPDRTLLAVTGRLEDFDVGASAELALYGAMPATIFPSPGTVVEVTLIWLTPAQLTQLAWAEVPYWLGRLNARFEAENVVAGLGFPGTSESLVFVNRFGTFAPEGQPIALAAIGAEGRRVQAMAQVELLERLASTVFGPGLTARELVRRTYERLDQVGPEVARVMRSNSIPFESDRWTPYPGP